MLTSARVPIRWGLFLSLALLAASAGRAHAEAPSAAQIAVADAIVIGPGVGCLTRTRLAGHVRAWLKRAQVSADLRVLLRGDAQRVEFELVGTGTHGTRAFDPMPEDCEAAHALIGFAIALAIDADLLAGMIRPPRPAPADPALLTAELGVGYGVLLDASWGARIGLELALLDWLSARTELWAEYAPRLRIEPSPGRFDASLFAANLRACAGGWVLRALRVALCSGPSAGAVHAAGRDFAVASYAPTSFWLGVVSGVRFELSAGLPVVFDVDMVTPLRAPSFRVESVEGPVRRAPRSAGVQLRLGVGVRF